MEAFKNFMTEVKFLLPNWSWIAIALVVAAMIIIIACTVVAGRRKKQSQGAEQTSAEKFENGENTDGYDKLIEPFYPVADSLEISEGSAVLEEVLTPVEQPVETEERQPESTSYKEVYEQEPEALNRTAESVPEQPAEEIEYRSEQVAAGGHIDEVTYAAVVTPVEETEQKPTKKTTAKNKTAKSASTKKSTAKTAAKKTTAKSSATSKTAAKKPVVKKTETSTVKLVKEEEIKEEPQITVAEKEKKSAAKQAKPAAAKKPSANKTAAKKPTEKKAQPAKPAKTKPAKDDSIPKVSDVLTEDIPEPVRTEPEVAPVKPKAKQTVLKAEDKNEVAEKPEEKQTETKQAKPAAAKKPSASKTAAKKPAEKKSAVKKPAPKKADIADVAQKVAKSAPTGPEKVYHVSRRPQDNKWEVRLEGSSKAIKLFRTKAEAMDYAIPLAGDDSDNSRVVIHKADGRPKNIAFL